MTKSFFLPSTRLPELIYPLALVALAGPASAALNFTGKTLSDIFWQLEYVNTSTTGPPSLGGQNFTTCCIKAIDAAVEINAAGQLQFTPGHEKWITFGDSDDSLDLLYNYSLRDQFPCTAIYNNDPLGAPVVQVNYTWLNANCPGWSISSKDNLNAWLQPLSGFLVPAVIFCLSVPRRRKIEVPRIFFAPDQAGIKSYLVAPFGAACALVIVALDTIIWLCICFAFAGPMILSGLYEAMLDNCVIDYLKLKIDESRLTLDMRCRCLMVILIGNLDLVWNTDDPYGNGGYVDGGNQDDHDDSYMGYGSSEEVDGATHPGDEHDGGGDSSFDDPRPRGNSGDIPLVAIRRAGAYQAIPDADRQQSPALNTPRVPYMLPPQGEDARRHVHYATDQASVSLSASPVPLAPPRATPDPRASSPPQLPPLFSSPPAPATPPRGRTPSVPLNSPFWGQTSDIGNVPGSVGQTIHSNRNSPHSTPVVQTPGTGSPEISNLTAQYPIHEHEAEPDKETIVGLNISSASAALGSATGDFTPSPHHQLPESGIHPGTSDDGILIPTSRPPPALDAGSDTPFAASGFVGAGVVAAGVGVGVSQGSNRRLLVNHRNGGPLASPWQHMEELLYDLRLYDDDFPTRGHSPRQYARHQHCAHGIDCLNKSHNETPIPQTTETKRLIGQTKTRLKTMLHCQYSFGSVVGAPVIFFLGGFIFALLQSLASLGDEEIAEGLAFGQWYMTIPHIAIISGLLLAGNNPNILEGVLAVDRKYRQDNYKIFGITYGLAYPSCYKVAWLWDRGHNKKQWLNTLIATYLMRHNADYDGHEDVDKDMVDLRNKTTLSLTDWFVLLALTMLLLGLPYVLAFLTAYYTPEIGLSCRSLTFTIYIIVQTCLILLWLWAYAGPLALFSQENPGFFRVGGWLDRRGFYRPYSLRWLVERGQAVPRNPRAWLHILWHHPGRLFQWQFLWNMIYYPSQWVLGIIGITAAIGGTMMQILGVYSADICYVTTPYWFKPMEERPMAIVSVNSADMILQADIMWKPTAITAICFMSVVSFVGWWYQRRMRDLFFDQVKRIDQNECIDTLESLPDRGRNRARTISVPLNVRGPTPSMVAMYVPSGGMGAGSGAAESLRRSSGLVEPDIDRRRRSSPIPGTTGASRRLPYRQTPSPRPPSTDVGPSYAADVV